MRLLTPIVLLLSHLTISIAIPNPAPQLLGSLTSGLTSALESLGLTSLGPILEAIPFIDDPPPAFLFTKYPSPACAAINGGTELCCQSIFNGDLPLIVNIANATAYKLNPNSVNCINGIRNTANCQGSLQCCQVDALIDPLAPVLGLALFCQQAPSS